MRVIKVRQQKYYSTNPFEDEHLQTRFVYRENHQMINRHHKKPQKTQTDV